MNFAIVSLFPPMFAALSDFGVTGRAVANGKVRMRCFNPRDYTTDKHRTVDDRPYGGGPGMVMRVEPLQKAVADAKSWLASDACCALASKVICLSPQGRRLDQAGVEYLRQTPNLVLVAGRYEGIDERFIQREVDEEWSIGDYVLSGGELPAMVLMDALVRLQPGVLGDEDSAAQDSFHAGLLDCPHYTRPEVYQGVAVPEVLLSGNHRQIALWRRQQSLLRTAQRRPDLLHKAEVTEQEQFALKEFVEPGEADRRD